MNTPQIIDGIQIPNKTIDELNLSTRTRHMLRTGLCETLYDICLIAKTNRLQQIRQIGPKGTQETLDMIRRETGLDYRDIEHPSIDIAFKFQINDIVYFMTRNNKIIRGKIISAEYAPNTKTMIYQINMLEINDKPVYDTELVDISEKYLFKTKKECREFLRQSIMEQVATIKSELTSVEDVLEFLFERSYLTPATRIAVLQKLEELGVQTIYSVTFQDL